MTRPLPMFTGLIVGLVRRKKCREESVLLCVEDHHGHEHALRVQERRRKDGVKVKLELGDEVIWNSTLVWWTPLGEKDRMGKEGIDWDVQLQRVIA